MAEKTFTIGGEFTVNRLGFGAMQLPGENVIGPPADVDSAREVLQRAADLVDLIDTADSYGPGVSERLIGETLAPYEDVIIATKGGLLRNRAGDWIACGDPDYLRNAVLCSLDRLRVSKIDLYQLHRPDTDVNLEDSISALAELRDDGIISHIGLSNVNTDQLATARDIVEIATVQNPYNIDLRDHDDVLEMCEDAEIGFIPWFPLNSGGLDTAPLEPVAANHDATPYQIALVWLLARSPVMLPIPGTSNMQHLEENVAAQDIELTEEEMTKLSE